MKTLRLVTTLMDGGTKVYIEKGADVGMRSHKEFETIPRYYLDQRYNSSTHGELFDNIPVLASSNKLNKADFILEDKPRDLEKELFFANERIALLENQVEFKNQLLSDSKELLETCVNVVNEKNKLLKAASDMLEDLLDKADSLDELKELLEKSNIWK